MDVDVFDGDDVEQVFDELFLELIVFTENVAFDFGVDGLCAAHLFLGEGRDEMAQGHSGVAVGEADVGVYLVGKFRV